MTETLTTEQQAAVDMAVKSVRDQKPVFRLGGYAGTGKTTVARHIVEKLQSAGDDEGSSVRSTCLICMPCAFTGKAAYRLEQKGLFGAQTIHRTIYDYDGHKFHKKPYVDGDWFLIDEGSMVSTDLWVDLLSYGKPIIMLGDPGQLEPVGKDPRLMHKADVVLDKIHRQAAESGIIQFATYVRLGKVLEHDHSDEVDIYHGENPTVKDLKWADIILCGFNHTRIKLNRVIRGTRAFGGLLNSGEKIIILKNNPNFGVFNGQILTVKRIISNGRRLITCDCLVDDGRQVSLPLYKEQFGSKLVDFKKISSDSQKIVLADYGYCITTHKSQGSEWDKVLVIDEQCQIWDSKRWRYTAITRAAVELKYYFK